MNPTHIALCGPFDPTSYGDALASLIMEDALRAKLSDVSVTRYSQHTQRSHHALYEIRTGDDFAQDLVDLDGVVVGNLTPLTVAPQAPRSTLAPAGALNDPTVRWLAPIMAAATLGLPVCWNGVTMHDIAEWGSPSLTLALTLSRYVSARDEATQRAFRRAGFDGETPLVPSVLFDAPRLAPINTARTAMPEPVHTALRMTGAGERYVVIEDNDASARILHELTPSLVSRNIVPLLLSPTGQVAGLTSGTDRLAPQAPSTLLSPIEITSLIGHSAGLVALDDALIVTGLAYGLPVLRPDTATGVCIATYSEEVFCATAATPIPPTFIEQLSRTVLGSAAKKATSVLDAHWNSLAAPFMLPAQAHPSHTLVSCTAWTRMLLASQQQWHTAASPPSCDVPIGAAKEQNMLRAELRTLKDALAHERALHEQEHLLHETWQEAAKRTQARVENERERLLAMKRSFDAALHALTRKSEALERAAEIARDDKRETEAALDVLKWEIQQLRSSLSWRITGPLRHLKDRMRGPR